MRPHSIVTFEWLFLLSISLSAAQLALYVAPNGNWLPAEIALGVGLIVVSVALVLLVSRRRSAVAKWALTALTLVGLVATGFGIADAIRLDELGLIEAVDVLVIALQAAAVALLFTREGQEWFSVPDAAAEG